VDAVDVYYIDIASSTIRKVPLTGGSAGVVGSSISPTSIAINGTAVYWTDGVSGLIYKLTKSSGVVTKISVTPDAPAISPSIQAISNILPIMPSKRWRVSMCPSR
jgi:hypothetical protein